MRRAVLAEDAFGGHPVDLRDDGGEARLSRGLVAGLDGFHDFAYRRAHGRAQCSIVRPALDGLPGPFLC